METYGIEKYGIRDPKSVNRNVSPAVLVETALRTEPCRLTDKGALLIETGKYTGRSPKDRFIADEDGVRDEINWGAENQKISAETFETIYGKVAAYLSNRDIYVFDGSQVPYFGARDKRVCVAKPFHAQYAHSSR